MPQQWLVKRPQASTGPPPSPEPDILPNAVLGNPVLVTSFSTDENHQAILDVTIPINWPSNNWADVERLTVHLYAPDNYVDTQEAFVREGDNSVGIVIGDASTSSKVVSIESAAVMIEKTWDPNRPFVQFTHPLPTETERWRAIVVSASKLQTNRVDTSPSSVFGVTPKGPDVSGREYAPLALEFHLYDKAGNQTDQPYYEKDISGVWHWGFNAKWLNDTKDPRFADLGGYDIDIVYPKEGSNPARVETFASKSSNDLHHESPLWPIGAPGAFAVRLVSWSSQAGNKRNTYIDGLTPERKFNVAEPVGVPGNEFAANVTNFVLNNPYYGKNSAGQKTLFLPFTWVKPADTAYGGAIISVILTGNPDALEDTHIKLTGLETDDNQVCEIAAYPVVSTTWIFTIRSVSTTGKPNAYKKGFLDVPPVAGSTPAILTTINPPATSTPKVLNYTADVWYGTDQNGLPIYGYKGSWSNPSRTTYPEFQGTKVYYESRANPDSTKWAATRKPLTGVEAGSSFKTSGWPVVPETAVWLYFISVDVNGVELPFTSDVVTGPLTVAKQDATLSGDVGLPPLDIGLDDFVTGIEPVGSVTATANAFGVLPASVLKTATTVFNTTDKRLYRWSTVLTNDHDGQTTPAYKVVGSAVDMDFNSVTAGYIATSAVITRHLASQTIVIGPPPVNPATGQPFAPERPVVFIVQERAASPPAPVGTMKDVGAFGQYLGWEGLWCQNLRVGPTFNKPIIEGSSGGLAIVGSSERPATFLITNAAGSSDYVRIDTAYLAPTYASPGVNVSSAGALVPGQPEPVVYRTWNVSKGFVGYYRAAYTPPANPPLEKQIFAMARNPFHEGGELVLYGIHPNGTQQNTVYISAMDGSWTDGVQAVPYGIVRANRFCCGARPGVNPNGAGGYKITLFRYDSGWYDVYIDGGIITDVVQHA
jgi:hypothetical protein